MAPFNQPIGFVGGGMQPWKMAEMQNSQMYNLVYLQSIQGPTVTKFTIFASPLSACPGQPANEWSLLIQPWATQKQRDKECPRVRSMFNAMPRVYRRPRPEDSVHASVESVEDPPMDDGHLSLEDKFDSSDFTFDDKPVGTTIPAPLQPSGDGARLPVTAKNQPVLSGLPTLPGLLQEVAPVQRIAPVHQLGAEPVLTPAFPEKSPAKRKPTEDQSVIAAKRHDSLVQPPPIGPQQTMHEQMRLLDWQRPANQIQQMRLPAPQQAQVFQEQATGQAQAQPPAQGAPNLGPNQQQHYLVDNQLQHRFPTAT
ncbi:hypothetical protein B0T24DRAFT_712301 [Lasiosphaeria ovina]|uniref:Uncharacterized protein n=1 Tax=Lasiosphaeria ovina TaxID=92902 RepID=A0AAE0JV61_9PEZI|nr:hypothetical protein B0T24DRAFT_712301 [Lasiosphaeria ovina]